MAKKPTARNEFVMFDIVYEDGSQRSNRKVPAELSGALMATNRRAQRSWIRIGPSPNDRACRRSPSSRSSAAAASSQRKIWRRLGAVGCPGGWGRGAVPPEHQAPRQPASLAAICAQRVTSKNSASAGPRKGRHRRAVAEHDAAPARADLPRGN